MIWILVVTLIIGIIMVKIETRDPVDACIAKLVRESIRHEMKPDPKRGFQYVQAGYIPYNRGCSKWNYSIIRRKR